MRLQPKNAICDAFQSKYPQMMEKRNAIQKLQIKMRLQPNNGMEWKGTFQ